MAFKPTVFKVKPLALSSIFLTTSLLLLSLSLLLLEDNVLGPNRGLNEVHELLNYEQQEEEVQLLFPLPVPEIINYPRWYAVVAQEVKLVRKMKVGLVNMDQGVLGPNNDHLHGGIAETINVVFHRVDEKKLQWKDFFPEWIDEDEKWGRPSCPEIPMPVLEDYGDLDVVVARVPCGSGTEGEGVRDVFRLQVNLVVANLLVRSGWVDDQVDRTVYVVFIGSCGPMWELFRCDDLLRQEGNYWVYKPDLRRLKQKVLMPVGSCQLAPPHTKPGHEVGRRYGSSVLNKPSHHQQQQREAFVTVLHSSEAYVCGAIALAQSILQTNSTKDLVLLADKSISPKSLQGLRLAGWKVKLIKRIRSPRAKKDAYNEWNYSKLRIWELTQYDKVIFIDSDLVLVNNMDHFFVYPQLSAVGNDKVLFNSGVMLIEPSKCTFETLMEKRYKVASYNGGDQGFLNEMFTWWHRWPSTLNRLKIFSGDSNQNREIPDNVYAIHYLGLKPWSCYMDYDCNWDMSSRRHFASDAVHRRWWQVYEAMPKRLQSYCGLSEGMDARIRKWRGKAKEANFPDGHWKLNVKDPRRHQ